MTHIPAQSSNTIHKAAAIIIKDRKLLVERSPGRGKNVWIAPGGKLEPGENHQQALIRELREELGIDVSLQNTRFFGQFSAEAANHPGYTVVMCIYYVDAWHGTIAAGSEVEELVWVTTTDIGGLPMGSIFVHDVMPRLVAEGLLD